MKTLMICRELRLLHRRAPPAAGTTPAADDHPGLYYKLPFVDNVVYFEKRILYLDSPPLEIIAGSWPQERSAAAATATAVVPADRW